MQEKSFNSGSCGPPESRQQFINGRLVYGAGGMGYNVAEMIWDLMWYLRRGSVHWSVVLFVLCVN